MRDIHPCEGKDCMNCETCIFDVPLDDKLNPIEAKPLRADETCNFCGYLIKQYRDRGDTIFNACCGMCRIDSSTYSRPRTIDFRLKETDDIKKPEWCPKLKGATGIIVNGTETPSEAKERKTYTQRKQELEALPNHLDWEDIRVGKVYVIPSILGKKRKIVMPTFKSDYTLTCYEVEPNGNVTSHMTNIFKADIDVNFMIERKKF
jgi:hypothetical protein